jgi:hypothetical protein
MEEIVKADQTGDKQIERLTRRAASRAVRSTCFLAEKAEPGDDRSIIPDIGGTSV